MVSAKDYHSERENSWCPGCGNFAILEVLKESLASAGIHPHEALIISGIGQAGKLPQYMKVNMFNVLHGRTLPVATGAKLANHELVILAVGGDGDGYAEGGNHLIHAVRRNVDMTYLVHNNQIYGLTKGQASPTTDAGSLTTTTPRGNPVPGLNPITLMLGLKANFVARGYAGNKRQLTDLMEQALAHPGFSFIDILQPCVTFNKVNTYSWYSERVFDINQAGHDASDLTGAFSLAQEWGDRIPTGVFYKGARTPFHLSVRGEEAQPLVQLSPEPQRVEKFFANYV